MGGGGGGGGGVFRFFWCWGPPQKSFFFPLGEVQLADDMVQVAKNEMRASEMCFACLTWLCGLFVRTLISLYWTSPKGDVSIVAYLFIRVSVAS